MRNSAAKKPFLCGKPRALRTTGVVCAIVAIGAGCLFVHAAWRLQRLQAAIATWSKVEGSISRVHDFVRKSSFYVEIYGNYPFTGKVHEFRESWIRRELFDQDNSESGQRDLLRLAVNPKNPEEAIWRPDLQLPRAAKKYMNLRNTLIIGSAVAVVLLLFSAVFERKLTHES
jgi:hypothetical protein